MKTRLNIFLSILCELDILHTDSFALQLYEEHPYKYTFFGLKSLCEKYGIRTDGVLIEDKSDILSIVTPFVADYKNDHVLVKSTSPEKIEIEIYGIDYVLSFEDFTNGWSGCALLFYPDEKSIEPDYKKHKRQNLVTKMECSILVICFLCVFGFCVFKRDMFTFLDISSIVLSLLGCIISVMLLFQQLKVRNTFVENVCHVFKKSSCSNVLENKASKFLGKYSWAEVGFCYFLVNSFCLILSDSFLYVLACVGFLYRAM